MRELEQLLKALANRRRLQLMRELKNGRSLSVGDLARTLKLSVAATSKHLRLLARARIVEDEKHGLMVNYTLSPQLPHLARQVVKNL